MFFRTLITALALVCAASLASAHEYKLGSLVIGHPWSRATPKGATVAAGYMKLTNTGTTPDRLIGGSSEVATGFEVHEMTMDNGVMKMRALKDGLEIPPGGTVELTPGSYHVMLTGLTRQLAKGEKVKGSLTFEKAGKVDVEFVVEDMGGMPPHGDMKM